MVKIVQSKITLILISALIIGAVGIGFGLNRQPQAADDAQAGQPPPMPVQIEIIKQEPVTIWKEFSARMEAVDFAQIRPQVSGNITEIRFEDGQNVEKGDILYVIDPRPYEAAKNRAQADLDAAKNRFGFAQKELERAKGLITTNAISQRIYDERVNESRVTWADVKRAEAQLEQTKIDLDYAYVKAPITGRVSRAEITQGNLVEAGPNAPVLTSIVSSEGIYADFEVDEQTYLNFIRAYAKDKDSENQIPVKLSLNGDTIQYDGFMHSFDNRLDGASGTIRARAYLKNEDGGLLPGMFARIEVASPETQDKILLTERALGTNQDRKFVYVVDDSNIVGYREVSIGDSIDGKRVILEGLKVGDRVIVDGIIRIRPEMPVDPQIQKASLEAQQ